MGGLVFWRVSAAPASPDRIAALTGLRFFAATAIVMHHLPGLLWLPPHAYGPIPLHQGVSFFYVLSGFILQHAYRERLGGMTDFKFMALRFWRLWPCHIAVILLIILSGGWDVVKYFAATYTPAQIVSATFLFQAWSPDTKGLGALNGPAWSLSAEMFFYAMFPFLSRQAIVSPWRPVVIGTLMTFAWLCGLWLYKPDADVAVLTICNPLARIFEFTIGVSAYEAVTRYRMAIANNLSEVACVVLVAACVVLTSIAVSFAEAQGSIVLSNWMKASFSAGAFVALIVVFFHERGRISRLVACAPVVYLGEISFALYLVHQPVIFYFSYHAPWFSSLPVAVQVIMFVIVTLALSAGLHHLVEKPCMSLAKKRILSRPKVVLGTNPETN